MGKDEILDEIKTGELYCWQEPESGRQSSILVISPENIKGDLTALADVSEVGDWKDDSYLKVSQKDLEEGEVSGTLIFPVSNQVIVQAANLRKKAGILKKSKTEQFLRAVFSRNSKWFYDWKFGVRSFTAGQSRVNYAGRVFDENEISNAVNASLDFWLTEGHYCQEFAEKISNFLGVDNVLLTNSGSSANLLAFAALTSEKLGEKRLRPGDEVLSVAAGFPSTITPIIQYQLVPVFADVDPETYNIDIAQAEKAISEKTKCIFLAHTLGNPFNLDAILSLAEKHGLWVIEDNCDAFGSKYKGRYTGTFGHISTISFYPAHHITTGEGGAILTNDSNLAQIVMSFRDWGRACYCAGGENNTCGKRFTQQFGNLPVGYDHKYVYSEIGYNLRMTELQAAIGSAQMDKLEYFCGRRRSNFQHLFKIFSRYPDYFRLPKATEGSDPAWFAFIITLTEKAPFSRDQLTAFLNERLIETRNLFAGNITKQPAYLNQRWRIADHLATTDYIMENTFFLGTYPGLTEEMISYIGDVLDMFLSGHTKLHAS